MKTALDGMTMIWSDGIEEEVSNIDLDLPDTEDFIKHWDLDESDYLEACEKYIEEYNEDLKKEGEGFMIIDFRPIYTEVMDEDDYDKLLDEQERENRFNCLGTAYEY